jgi:hypothetical protein
MDLLDNFSLKNLDDVIELSIYSSVYVIGGIIMGKLIDNIFPEHNPDMSFPRLLLEIILQGAADIVLSYLIRKFIIKYLPPLIPFITFDKLDMFGSRRSGGVVFAFAIISGQANLKNKVNDFINRVFKKKFILF